MKFGEILLVQLMKNISNLCLALLWQGLLQPKNESDYRLWAQRFMAQKFVFFKLPVLSKTVENKNFSWKWYNSYSKVHTQRTLYLETKLMF